MQKYAVIVAGGSGRRMKGKLPKQFLVLAGRPILMHTLEAYHNTSKAIELILVLPEDQVSGWKSLCARYKCAVPHSITYGGETRFHSVKNGLELVPKSGLVAIHDGVRPLVSSEIIRRSFEIAEKKGNAVAAVPVKDSIRWAVEDQSKVLDRDQYQLIQTPQTFRSDLIKEAFRTPYDPAFTDDATVIEKAGEKVHLIEGSYRNIKITTPEDLALAEVLLSQP